MKKLGIRSIVVKKHRLNSTKKVYEEGENLLNRNFSTTKINEKWAADITYIHTQRGGWTYLASVLDFHTQKIVGYSFPKTMDTSLVLWALDNAMITHEPAEGLIIHSDRGSEYSSKEQRKAIESNKFNYHIMPRVIPMIMLV